MMMGERPSAVRAKGQLGERDLVNLHLLYGKTLNTALGLLDKSGSLPTPQCTHLLPFSFVCRPSADSCRAIPCLPGSLWSGSCPKPGGLSTSSQAASSSHTSVFQTIARAIFLHTRSSPCQKMLS